MLLHVSLWGRLSSCGHRSSLKEFNLQTNPDKFTYNVKAVKVKVLHVCSAHSQLVMDVPILVTHRNIKSFSITKMQTGLQLKTFLMFWFLIFNYYVKSAVVIFVCWQMEFFWGYKPLKDSLSAGVRMSNFREASRHPSTSSRRATNVHDSPENIFIQNVMTWHSTF